MKSDKALFSRSFIIVSFALVSILMLDFYIDSVKDKLPNHVYILENDEAVFNYNVPVSGKLVSGRVIDKNINLIKPTRFVTGKSGHYSMELRLFGLFHFDDVDIDVVSPKSVYPGGFQVGLYMKCDGVVVVNTEKITCNDGTSSSPCDKIISKGDYIISVNGNKINKKEEVSSYVNNSGGSPMIFTIRRNDDYFEAEIVPVMDKDSNYRIGLWIKDDAQGVGTITYIDNKYNFGALGHGISDADTGNLLEISDGRIYKTNIISIVKGKNGTPGELLGTIDYKDLNILGRINRNSENGIYGIADMSLVNEYNLSLMDVGFGYEVKKGSAYIRFYEKNKYKDYEILITEIKTGKSKNLTYQVSSEELLNKTNGIVQGMSGSPIIQDGKIIGAVTHVFVDDSTKGYGIFIENMLE